MDGIETFGEVDGAEPPEDPRSRSLRLYVVVFLVFQTLFVALVSISTREGGRGRAVMHSLSSTFASVVSPTTSHTAFNAYEGDALGGQRFQEEITRVFSAAIQIVEVEVVEPGRDMRLKMPVERLFAANSGDVRPDQIALLDRIVAELSSAPAGVRYDMELMLGSDTVEGALPIGSTLAMKRIGAFARELTARGAPAGSLSVGLRPGRSDELTMSFYVRPVEAPGGGRSLPDPAGGRR